MINENVAYSKCNRESHPLENLRVTETLIIVFPRHLSRTLLTVRIEL